MQKIKKLIAAMLVVLLLTEMLPLQVFAEEVSNADNGMVEEMEASQAEEEGPHEMLAEITEKRDEDTKHFLNSDGTYTAVKYSQPVHYQESPDGEWVDINNTLVLTNAEKAPGVKRARRAGSGAYPQSGSEVYVPADSPIDVVFAKDTSGMYLATLNYGDYTLSWQYAVRYAVTEDEETAGSNDAIVEEPSGEEEDPAGEEISATEEETTGEDEETIGEESMPPEEPATTEEFVTEEAATEDETPAVEETAITEDVSLEESSIPASRIEEAALARVAAQSLEPESDPTQKNTVEQQAVKSVTDGLIYRDVAPDVDLEYVLNSIYLKENVVLKSPEAAHEFLLTYHIGELKAEQISEQEIALKAEDGTIVYTIYAPYMIDADRTVSTGVSLTIVSVEDGQLVAVLTADGEWLSDPARNYPVKIDPYISQGVTSHLLSNAQNATARQYSSGGVPYGSLVIGNDYGASYGKTRVYIKFELPELQAGDVVINGQMGLVQYNDTYGVSTFRRWLLLLSMMSQSRS